MEPQPEPQLDEAARKIAEALDGGVEEREAQYASLEGAMRAACLAILDGKQVAVLVPTVVLVVGRCMD